MIPTFKKADIKLEYHTAKVHNNFNKKKDYATFFGKIQKKPHIHSRKAFLSQKCNKGKDTRHERIGGYCDIILANSFLQISR